MQVITQAGITPAELDRLTAGEIWSRWCVAEPDLATVASLGELEALKGAEEDGPLGALVRLAAKDGGDDELAGIAVVHQLHGGIGQLIGQFYNLTEDVEAVIVGALWEQIRTFPWQRRTGHYAANLVYDTRTAVRALLLPDLTRSRRAPLVLIDPQSSALDALADPRTSPPHEDACTAATELTYVLEWAIKRRVVTREDARLLAELVTVDHEHFGSAGSPEWMRGICSMAAVATVASRHRVSSKTVVRQRNLVVASLRRAARRYLNEAA